MTNFWYNIVNCFFFLWILRNTLFWVALWQDKEYRKDRLFVHIRETIQGRMLFFSPSNIIKISFFILFLISVFNDTLSRIFPYCVGVIFVYQGISVFKQVVTRRIKRPKFTVKAIALVLLSLFLLIGIYLLPLTEIYLWLLIIDRLVFFVVSFFIFTFSFPTEIYKDIEIKKAKEKMGQYKTILVIAVSGSYGKTSTKEYIAQVLSKKFKVVKTPGSTNTAIGIAKVILQSIKADTEIFVVEMGAYKKREIADITDMIPPHVSVTTAVSDQHISLYGNLQNVLDSEYELIQALPKDGLALFNKNSISIEKLYEKTKIKKQWYFTDYTKTKLHGMFVAIDISSSPKAISFVVSNGERKTPYVAPLLGKHTVQNILPAIYLAEYLKIPIADIQKSVGHLISAPQTMMRSVLPNGALVIDDTFNASPESVSSAMQYMGVYRKQKIFVLAPLIELGNEAKKRHYQIGMQASKTCDYLFLLNKNFSKEIIEGIKEGKGKCRVIIENSIQAAKEIKQIIKKDDVVVCEGKESRLVMKKLYE